MGCGLFSQTYTRISKIEGQGAVTPGKGSQSNEEGTIVVIEAELQEDWGFSHWVGEASNSESFKTRVLMYEDREIAVLFEKEESVLTTKVGGEGVIKTYPDQENYHYGAEVVKGYSLNIRIIGEGKV